MTDLRKAAQAVVERWDTPSWKDVPATAIYIEALRQALAQPEQEQPKHWSDCSVYNEPAYPNGECDCGGFALNNKWHGLTEEEAEKLAFHVIVDGVSKALAQKGKECIYPECETGVGCDGPCGEKPVDTVNTAQPGQECTCSVKDMPFGKCCKAQPEQEPFIYVREDTEKPFGGYEHCSEADAGAFPVYTAPPKREWVGLTDEEILDSADAFGSFQYGDAQGHKRLEFAKAIEAKLKEKNS